jgi:hypothetical protein
MLPSQGVASFLPLLALNWKGFFEVKGFFSFLFLVVLGFELTASHLLGKHSTT